VYLEVYRYPSKEYLGITEAKDLTLVDVGLNEDRLKELDEQQDQTQFIEYEGKRWYYDSSRELGYFENETGEGEGLYRWLFREQDGPRRICIEKWEGEPFDVRLARQFGPQDITVYRAA